MIIHLGGDHAGYDLKQRVAAHLKQAGHQVVDHGALAFDAEDDYPAFCIEAAEAVAADPHSLGIVFGGSGNGEQMAANLVRGVRCALAWNIDTAKLAREHNNANCVSIGARMHSEDEALAIIDAFISQPFSADARHCRRIAQMDEYRARA